MKIYTVDFETIIKNFIPYHDSLKSIQSDKKSFSDKIEKIKVEMEGIVSASKSLILDNALKTSNADRFKALQTEAIQLESEFRAKITQKQNDELESNFNQIIKFVDEWSVKNDADLIINKNSVVFSKPEFDITLNIIDILKESNLYKDHESVMLEMA